MIFNTVIYPVSLTPAYFPKRVLQNTDQGKPELPPMLIELKGSSDSAPFRIDFSGARNKLDKQLDLSKLKLSPLNEITPELFVMTGGKPTDHQIKICWGKDRYLRFDITQNYFAIKQDDQIVDGGKNHPRYRECLQEMIHHLQNSAEYYRSVSRPPTDENGRPVPETKQDSFTRDLNLQTAIQILKVKEFLENKLK